MKPALPPSHRLRDPLLPRATCWVKRCAQCLANRLPELTEEESMLAAEDLWEASHLALTPEQAADFATGKVETD
jgi:hypothetical protein